MQDWGNWWIDSISIGSCVEQHETTWIEKVVNPAKDNLSKGLSVIVTTKEEDRPFHKKVDATDAIYWNDEWNNWQRK